MLMMQKVDKKQDMVIKTHTHTFRVPPHIEGG